MFARGLELERVETDGAGGVVLWFDDGGAKRPCRLPAKAADHVLAAFARAQVDADNGLSWAVGEIMLRDPVAPGEPPVLGVWPERWPRLALALTWAQLTALSKAAEGALQAAKTTGRRRQ